jgi:hypothetical protein
MRKKEVSRVLGLKYEAYVQQVIALVRALPDECRQSGDDSVLGDVWEEFKCQVQREESGVFDAYVETIQEICAHLVGSLPDHEVEFLWLDSEGYWDHDEDEERLRRAEMEEAVTRELYGKVAGRAADEELKIDPDEQRSLFDARDETPNRELDVGTDS